MAYDLYDGISDQVYCNSDHPESEALEYWLNIYVFAPENYAFVSTWNRWWRAQANSNESRRTAFEKAYKFSFGQEWNPILQKFVPVIRIGAFNYFDFLQGLIFDGTPPCSELMYPSW